LNSTWDGVGCFGKHFEPGHYEKVILEEGEIIQDRIPSNHNLTFTVRNGKDPLF
jgi:hypothetical protein